MSINVWVVVETSGCDVNIWNEAFSSCEKALDSIVEYMNNEFSSDDEVLELIPEINAQKAKITESTTNAHFSYDEYEYKITVQKASLI